MTDLLKLAERVEAATGLDRELDVAILTQVLGYRDIFEDGSLFDRDNDGYWSLEGDEKNAPLPSPTSSLDAAMTLVPEDWRFGLERPGMFDGKQIEEAWCWPFDSGFDPDWKNGQQGYRDAPEAARGFAATPALALCAAALRARASMEKNNG